VETNEYWILSLAPERPAGDVVQDRRKVSGLVR
jgi:hypothetical protein